MFALLMANGQAMAQGKASGNGIRNERVKKQREEQLRRRCGGHGLSLQEQQKKTKTK